MIVTCHDCQKSFDDARRSTICPHDQFLPDDLIEQKDLAISLIGKDLCFAHEPTGPRYRIQSVSFDGMVTLAGDKMVGEFAPHLFVVAKDAGP